MIGRRFKTWVVYRPAKPGESIVNDIRDMCHGNMMIGGQGHVIIGIKQVVPITDGGDTTGYLIVLDVEATA